MTGEEPSDDSVAPDDVERLPADADFESDDAELEPEDDVEPVDDVDDRDSAIAPPGAPFAQPKASERVSGRTRTPVVTDTRSRAVVGDDEVPYIDDRVSKYWVGAIALIFLLILLYGLLFGHAGLFSPPPPTEAPIPTDTPAAAISPAPTLAPSVVTSALPSVPPSLPASLAPGSS